MPRTIVSDSPITTAFVATVWKTLTSNAGTGEHGTGWTVTNAFLPADRTDRDSVLGYVHCPREDIGTTAITVEALAAGIAQWTSLTLTYPEDQSRTDMAAARAVDASDIDWVNITDLMAFVSLREAAELRGA